MDSRKLHITVSRVHRHIRNLRHRDLAAAASPQAGERIPHALNRLSHQSVIDRPIDRSSRPIDILQPGEGIRGDVYLVTVCRLDRDSDIRRMPKPANHLPKAKLSLHGQTIPLRFFVPNE
ncbi:hypothetical protein [Micromonospora avicenniae]|uniref:hypothetical protein n=1 Tax=Micromonospora avicenniae TaxID=1198245 RepID=UPI0034305BB4